MKLSNLLAAVVAAAFMAITPATAATVANGETFCDSLNRQNDNSSCINLGMGDQDLGQNPNKTITFLGSGMLKGWVKDDRGTNNQNFRDTAKIVLSKASKLIFEIFDTDPGFAGTVSLTPGGSALMGVGGETMVMSGVLAAGEYIFSFDAANPNEDKANTTEYKLTVSAVPLPAAAWLMLAGLGGIAAVKRRKS